MTNERELFTLHVIDDELYDSGTPSEDGCYICALERTAQVRADYDLRCQDCGGAHFIDTVIPSEIWNVIAGDLGVLCTLCVDKRLEERGLTALAEFYYAGTALNSKLYEESQGEVEFERRRVAALEARVETLQRERDEASIDSRYALLAARGMISFLRSAVLCGEQLTLSGEDAAEQVLQIIDNQVAALDPTPSTDVAGKAQRV